ncbi:MAG: DnaA family protein [Candidatus Azotimanducaceae bacterium]
MPDLLPDLASRLNAAYSLQTDVLKDVDKLDVIRRKAAQRGFDMPEDVCRFILSRAPRDMNHLAALVMRLDEESLSRQKKVTIPFVKTALGL